METRSDREALLAEWVAECQGLQSPPTLLLIAGDASPRRYFRVELPSGSKMAVDSPPTEKNPEFLSVRAILESASVRVPGLIAADVDKGFLLLEDLGNQTLLPLLTTDTVDGWYDRALNMLAEIAAINSSQAELPRYNKARLETELDLFPEWFVRQLLGKQISAADQKLFSDLSSQLICSAEEQPQVVVHRDFHGRNLMVLEDGTLATIDFQDAVVGPITYDPVSLLKDCYVRWPRERQLRWLAAHQRILEARGLMPSVPQATFIKWFDLMGLQRHIKVLGIFARLWLRDGKSGYLNDLPLVLAYTRETLALYSESDPAVAAFAGWFEGELVPACENQDWYRHEPVNYET